MATPTIEILNKGRGVIAKKLNYTNTSKLRRLTAPGESDTVIGMVVIYVKLGRVSKLGMRLFL